MHELIEKARRSVDGAELYWKRDHTISVRYENYRLQGMTEDELSSVALRVIAGARLGATYGVNPEEPGLIEQAKQAARFGDEAGFSFAGKADYESVENYDKRSEALTSADLVALCERVKEMIAEERPEIPLFIVAGATKRDLVVETTAGAAGRDTSTRVTLGFGAPIKGAGIGVYKSDASVSPLDLDPALIDEFLEWYGWTENKSTPKTGRLPIILAPEAAYLFLLPLAAGLSGEAVEKGTSPLIDKIGERIVSERLTVIDDPLRDGDPGSRPFDDEGVPCRRRPLLDAGVLTDYLTDLRTGAALGRPSTGNGLKRELFGGGTETRPNPWPVNITVEPGDTPYREMISSLDEGLLVTGGMGFHSGNYPQGEFAVQAIGFHIKNGKVVGRLDRTMISGNIYKDFKDVAAVSRERRLGPGGMLPGGPVPYILVDSLRVAGE